MTGPFLKWAGGKGQLLTAIDNFLPKRLKQGCIKKYFEPMIGGGAVFFHLAEHYEVEQYFISDINEELFLAYCSIQRDVENLIARLKKLQKSYFVLTPEEQKLFFYKTRLNYNRSKSDFNFNDFNSNWIERTAQIIFLNKTCFNGLFRVNSKGGFNVPHGRYDNPTICDAENLRAVASLLQKTEIRLGDFTAYEQEINADSFVYFDPPYRPLTKTSSFTAYAKGSFNDNEQLRLAKFYRELDKKGAALMLSNSDPKNQNINDNFFEDAYHGFKIQRVPASRMINSKAAKRGVINELVITNYTNSELGLS